MQLINSNTNSSPFDFFSLQQRKTTQVNLQKDVINLLKLLRVRPYAKGQGKKVVNTGGGQKMAVMVGQ